jgi:hypothetical protein
MSVDDASGKSGENTAPMRLGDFFEAEQVNDDPNLDAEALYREFSALSPSDRGDSWVRFAGKALKVAAHWQTATYGARQRGALLFVRAFLLPKPKRKHGRPRVRPPRTSTGKVGRPRNFTLEEEDRIVRTFDSIKRITSQVTDEPVTDKKICQHILEKEEGLSAWMARKEANAMAKAISRMRRRHQC